MPKPETPETQDKPWLGGKACTTDGRPPAAGFEHASAPQPVDSTTGQHGAYWVLCEDERRKGFIRPVRRTYRHEKCGTETRMGEALAETYACKPDYYGATFCVHCGGHYPVGEHGEFVWLDDGTKVGT